MAPERSTPTEEASTSLEEEEITSSGEEEEEESSSEDDQTKRLEKRSSQPRLTQTSPDSAKHATSESESESDSESENIPLPPLNAKPLVEESPNGSTKIASKSTGKYATKRGREVDKDGKDSKQLKSKDSESMGPMEKTTDTKKQLFQRVWSEEDEVALLKGFFAFIKKKRFDPTKNMNTFYDFIKKSVHCEFCLSQLKDKVLRLKKKFRNQVSKGKHGDDKRFSRGHDQNLFDLSKKIWVVKGFVEEARAWHHRQV